MKIFKTFRGFCLKWTGSCRNISKVTNFSTENTNFGKSSDQNVNQRLETRSRWNFLFPPLTWN